MLEWLGDWAGGRHYWTLFAVFLALAGWETLRPTRDLRGSVLVRWLTNFGLFAANTGLLVVLAPALIAEAAVSALGINSRPFTLVGNALGDWGVLILAVLLFDLYTYVIHRIQHQIFVLWRFHAVHHSDAEMDASTTLRHHPFEVLFSTAVGAVLFAVLQVPSWTFPVYALFGTALSLVQHVNAGFPGPIDRALQCVLVTPGMHQVHHSVDRRDFNANFGTVFSIWDRLFGTYRPQPAGPLAYGVEPFTGLQFARPDWAIFLPFRMRRGAAASGESRFLQPVHDVLDGRGDKVVS